MYLKEYLRLRQKNPAHDKMKYYFEEVILPEASPTTTFAKADFRFGFAKNREMNLPNFIKKSWKNKGQMYDLQTLTVTGANYVQLWDLYAELKSFECVVK